MAGQWGNALHGEPTPLTSSRLHLPRRSSGYSCSGHRCHSLCRRYLLHHRLEYLTMLAPLFVPPRDVPPPTLVVAVNRFIVFPSCEST